MALKAEEVYAILKKQIESGGATPEQIESAVNKYLSENPVQAGATEEQAQQIDKNKSDIFDIQNRIYSLATDNVVDVSKMSKKGEWWYNGIKYDGGNDYVNSCVSFRINNIKPNTTYYFGTYDKTTLLEFPEGSSCAYFNSFDSGGELIYSNSDVKEYSTTEDVEYFIITMKLYSNATDETISFLPYCGTSQKPVEYIPYQEFTAEYVISEFSNVKREKRSVMYIMKEDNDTQLLIKMKEAFDKGNVDVIFEKSTYTLSEAYDHIRNVIGENWTVGLPVGNGCRYFFNDSTIISNPPSDNYSDSRNILDCKAIGSDYEIHDVTLINNGGRYCIHDEGNGSKIPYLHKYENVVMIYNKTDLTPDTGSKAFGCGTGFDASLSFDGCVFKHNNGQNAGRLAVHAPTSNPNSEPYRLHFSMKNCYFDDGSVHINQSLTPTSAEDGNFVKDVDTLDCFLFGNSFGSEFINISANVIDNNNTIRTN